MSTLLNIDKQVFSPPELGCVLYLPGLPGGGRKIHDRSPYGNQGTIVGATWKRLPSGLWYLALDGDDYVNCGDFACGAFDGVNNKLTALVWVNQTTLVSGVQVLTTKYKTETGQTKHRTFSWNIRSSGKINCTVYQDGDTLNYLAHITSAVVLTAGQWHRVGAVIDLANKNIDLYVDGVEKVSTQSEDGTPPTVFDNNEAEVWVGSNFDGAGAAGLFIGGIALPKLIIGSLSALAMQNDFQRTKHLFGVW